MPKMKTKRAAAKRFRVKKSGKVSYKKSHLRHNLGLRKTKAKRHLRTTGFISGGDLKKVLDVLPYA